MNFIKAFLSNPWRILSLLVLGIIVTQAILNPVFIAGILIGLGAATLMWDVKDTVKELQEKEVV